MQLPIVMGLLARVSEAAFKVRLRRGLLACNASPLSPSGPCLAVTAEKRRYHSGQLPMSVHSSKVAMPVNCAAAPLKLLTKVARDTNKTSRS